MLLLNHMYVTPDSTVWMRNLFLFIPSSVWLSSSRSWGCLRALTDLQAKPSPSWPSRGSPPRTGAGEAWGSLPSYSPDRRERWRERSLCWGWWDWHWMDKECWKRMLMGFLWRFKKILDVKTNNFIKHWRHLLVNWYWCSFFCPSQFESKSKRNR